jgi:hypothetical protein
MEGNMSKEWTEDEDVLVLMTWTGGHPAFTAGGGERSKEAYRKRRRVLSLESRESPLPTGNPQVTSQKFRGDVDWREMTEVMRRMQEIKAVSSETQQTAEIYVDSDRPIVVMPFGDTHIGAWSTDYDLFERITDEILETPNLFLCLMGDMAHMAIKLRSVEEISDNLLPPDLQLRYLQSWLEEVQHRILFCVWANHEVEREEAQAGGSRFADLYKRTAVYFGGIGHANVTVGSQQYRIAASHKFAGRSQVNPVYGPQRYLLTEGTDRDIAIAGDSHVPGIMKFTHGPDTRLAVNCGSIQTMSGYARRYFSLKTHPIFPVFTLHPERKLFSPYWSLEEYLHR